MPTKLIGLAGAKRSGKNTVAKLIAEIAADSHVVEGSFAAKLKIGAMRALGYRGSDQQLIELADSLKETGSLHIDIPDRFGAGAEITGREFFQWFGTECGRETFGQDFWIDQALPLSERTIAVIQTAEGPQEVMFGDGNLTNYDANGDPIDIWVFTDVRFENEAVRIHQNGGEVWQVLGGQSQEGDTHASEVPLDSSYVTKTIDNHGTINDLRQQVKDALYA